jgi:hypothetical protein
MANWVKCTHKGDANPVYVNIDSGVLEERNCGHVASEKTRHRLLPNWMEEGHD